MSDADVMGLTPEAAAGYEAFFLPAIFHQWPPHLLSAARIAPGDRVLDAGCGTGVVTRALVEQVGPQGSVVGADLSSSMLGVARSTAPGAEFFNADVTALPFADAEFDAVTSAFMLMFVPEPVAAIRELGRVTRPGGRLVFSVWQPLADNPVYQSLSEAVTDLVGADAGAAIAAPFSFGEPDRLLGVAAQSGAGTAHLQTQDGVARFASVAELVRTEVQAWVLAGDLSEAQIDAVIDRVSERLEAQSLLRDDGDGVAFPLNASLLVINRPG